MRYIGIYYSIGGQRRKLNAMEFKFDQTASGQQRLKNLQSLSSANGGAVVRFNFDPTYNIDGDLIGRFNIECIFKNARGKQYKHLRHAFIGDVLNWDLKLAPVGRYGVQAIFTATIKKPNGAVELWAEKMMIMPNQLPNVPTEPVGSSENY